MSARQPSDRNRSLETTQACAVYGTTPGGVGARPARQRTAASPRAAQDGTRTRAVGPYRSFSASGGIQPSGATLATPSNRSATIHVEDEKTP